MLYCASWDLLREARNVISRISINSAWAVQPFQPFVSPTVVPVHGSQRRFTQQFRQYPHITDTKHLFFLKKHCAYFNQPERRTFKMWGKHLYIQMHGILLICSTAIISLTSCVRDVNHIFILLYLLLYDFLTFCDMLSLVWLSH